MLALINSMVAGAGITMLADNLLGGERMTLAVVFGIASVLALMAAFLVYQRWRFRAFELIESRAARPA